MKRLTILVILHGVFLIAYSIFVNLSAVTASFNGVTRLIMLLEHLVMITIGAFLTRTITPDKNERFIIAMIHGALYLLSLYLILTLQVFMLK